MSWVVGVESRSEVFLHGIRLSLIDLYISLHEDGPGVATVFVRLVIYCTICSLLLGIDKRLLDS